MALTDEERKRLFLAAFDLAKKGIHPPASLLNYRKPEQPPVKKK